MNRRRILIAAGMFCAVTYSVAVGWVADPLMLGMVGLLTMIYIGLPVLAIAVLMALFATIGKGSFKPSFIAVSIVAAFLGCFLIAAIVNDLFSRQAVKAAKAYPMQVAPFLEAYRREHGFYPARLDDVSGLPRAPFSLQADLWYHSGGGSYRFSLREPGHKRDNWHYDGETQSWAWQSGLSRETSSVGGD